MCGGIVRGVATEGRVTSDPLRTGVTDAEKTRRARAYTWLMRFEQELLHGHLKASTSQELLTDLFSLLTLDFPSLKSIAGEVGPTNLYKLHSAFELARLNTHPWHSLAFLPSSSETDPVCV